jgi:hypothetical protein
MDLVNDLVNTKITDAGFGRIGSPPRLTNPPVRNAGAAPAAVENFTTDHRILRAFAGLEPGDVVGGPR